MINPSRTNKLVVYMCGQFTTDFPETFHWRDKAKRTLEATEVISAINPLHCSTESILKHGQQGGLYDPRISGPSVTRRDFISVSNSHLILVNPKKHGDRAPIGSFFELGWAWERHLPVVAFIDPKDEETTRLCKYHPFLSDTISDTFPSLEDACEYIIRYYTFSTL